MQDVRGVIEGQRAFFERGATRDVGFRKKRLETLKKAIKAHEAGIMEALKRDLNKSPFESYATEIGFVLEEISFMLRHLDRWAKPVKVRTPVVHFPSQSRIYSEPFGIALVMSPWNYPFLLTMGPLLGAIAGGNCVVLKPSEYSVNTAAIIEEIISENFDQSYIAVIRGGREANKTLLDERFDYIFFTGSVTVGKAVMKAASANLTPVSLELGGKSPCIVDETANIDLAARRIAWGKFINAGQTCVAPDYLLVQSNVKARLIQKIGENIQGFYGEDPCVNPDYPKIINDKHFSRLVNLMRSGNAAYGGGYVEATRHIAPTVIDNVTWESPIMQEEIFGPLLPVLEFRDIKEATAVVNSRPKPLALYLFTNDRDRERLVMKTTSFGGGCINDCVVHLATPHMPFGGVGDSGMGGYHGKASFDTFTHKKSVLKKSNLIDIPLRYPPYKNHLNLLKKFMK